MIQIKTMATTIPLLEYDFVDKVDKNTIYQNSSFIQTCIQSDSKHPTSVFKLLPNLLDMYQGSGKLKGLQSKKQSKGNLYLEVNSVLLEILKHIDSRVSLLGYNEQQAALIQFQKDLEENLTNENQWFRKLGFNRKKSIQLESMIINIRNTETNKSFTVNEYTYLANIIKQGIVLIKHHTDIFQFSRIDIIPTELMQTDTVIVIDMNKNQLMFQTDQSITIDMMNVLKENNINITNIKNLKVDQLRHICCLLGIDTKSCKKSDLIDRAEQKWKKIERT
jgi:hypothetical protein